jgi:hypothetical protein
MNYYFQIWGTVSEDRLAKTPPTCRDDEDGSYASLGANELESLGLRYREYLWDEISEEDQWDSTASVMDYLAMDVVSVSIGGFQPMGAPSHEWAIEILFNGCGGMSEVSSLLAAHWAQIWYQKNRAAIDNNDLIPFGFVPTEEQPQFDWLPFIPIGGGSYAAYEPDRRVDDDDSPFQLNCSLAMSLDDDPSQLLADLAKHYGKLIEDGQCRCQLCMPNWDHTAVACHTT